MGFFDTIEKLSTVQDRDRQPEATIILADRDEQPADRQPVETETKKKTCRKSERFSFLGPCVACSGRDFVYDDSGIFSCVSCEPGKPGHPAKATGPGRSGSHPDPDHQMTETACLHETVDDQPFFSAPAYRITAGEREIFVAAWPWIHNHMSELLTVGWTREALLQCSRIRYPLGKWGVAWYPVWKKEKLAVEIGRRGEIVFKFPTIRRTVTQTAHPPNRNTRKPLAGERQKDEQFQREKQNLLIQMAAS